jgi:hypothetical protein
MRWLLLAVMMFMLAACGSGVEWFPASTTGGSNNPSITGSTTASGVAANSVFTFPAVIVTGANLSGWTITIDGNGTFSIPGVTSGFVTSAVIQPGNSLTVQMKLTSGTSPGGTATTVVTIGGVPFNFTATTL